MKYTLVLFFSLTLLFIAGCGKSDKELLTAGQEELKKGNIEAAIADFEKITADHEKSESAATAFYELGRIYQNGLDPKTKKDEQVKKALKNYTAVFEKFEKNEKAPQAMFMTGYMYANELKNFDEATKVYNNFLKKYPSDQLAKSCKEELDNMGLTPEQILEKKMNPGQSAKK